MFLSTTDRQIITYLQGRYDKQDRSNVPPMEYNIVRNMDACDFLRTLPDNSVKLIFTDEPYGQAETRLNLKSRSDITTDFGWGHAPQLPWIYDGLLVGTGNEKPRLPTHLYTEWVWEAHRVLEEHGFLVNFGMGEFTGTFRDVCRAAGLTWRASGPWIKTNVAPHFRKNNFRSGYETWFVASKGTTKGYMNFLEQQEMVNYIIDVICPQCKANFPISFSNKYDEPKWFDEVETWFEISGLNSSKASSHPTEKPDWLVTKFLQIFSDPNDIVVDPFAGSGVTAAVAQRLNRRWVVNDLTKEWYDFIVERMKYQVQSYG